MLYRMVEVKENFVMKVNIKKTEIQYMRSTHKNFNIVIMNQNMNHTFNFVLSGGNLSSEEETISAINREIGIVRAVFQELGKVWSVRYIMTKTNKTGI